MKQKVYLMRNDLGLHKIGISSSPDRRAREVSNAGGIPTEVVKVWDSYNAYQTEQFLHKKFSNKRKSGEWFKLSKADIREVDSAFNEIDSLIPHIADTSTEYLEEAQLPCLDIKWILTKPKQLTSRRDVGGIFVNQYAVLNKLYKTDRRKYSELISEVVSEGFHVDPYWRSGTPEGPTNDLIDFSRLGGDRYPICTEQERLKMNVMYIDWQIAWYEKYIRDYKITKEEIKSKIDEWEVAERLKKKETPNEQL